MIKKLPTILLFFLVGLTTANAQKKTTVEGIVADADTRETMAGALIAIAPLSDTTKVTHYVTGSGGTFSTGLVPGEYSINVTLMGFETLRRTDVVKATKTTFDTLFIRGGVMLDAVTAESFSMRTSLRGDTIIYNADAFKVAADADVSGLLAKMPGIKVENGSVQAQGEEVKKILIDGREFFGEDVNAAITSLPAEVVKSVEVFDKLSDNAEFTGIDDGEGYKAINIRTRESMRQGVMGKVFATYGAEPPDANDSEWHHYGLVSGNVNIFQGDAKITLGGTLNNMNERNFTQDDFLGAGGGDGIAKVGVFSANYIDTWGKKNHWKIDATYRYNGTDAENLSQTDRDYYETSANGYSKLLSRTLSGTVNNNHSFGARIDFKPNSFHELRIRPSVRYQGNRSDIDAFHQYFLRDGSDEITQQNLRNANNTGWNTGLNANYRVRLGKPGRTLSLFFDGRYNTNDRTENSERIRSDIDPIRQRIPSFTYGYNLAGGLTYTEPVGKSSLVNLDYSIRYNFSDVDRKSYMFDFDTGEYETQENELYSNIHNSGYLTHRVGPGYRLQTENGSTLSAGVFYQHSTLTSNRVYPIANDLSAEFDNVTYSVMLNSKFGNGSSLRLFLNSYTYNPSVENLQDALDITNLPVIRQGDPNLKPSYGNRLFARFILPDVQRGRTFSVNGHISYTLNAISQYTIRDSNGYIIVDSDGQPVPDIKFDSLSQFIRPINLDGDWSARLGVDYGFPLNFMKSNLNLNANVSYRETPVKMGVLEDVATQTIDDFINRSSNLAAGGGLVLGSNISERVDFRVGYRVSYNKVRNSYLQQSNSSYMNHVVTADFKFVLPLDFTLAGNVLFTSYDALKGTTLDNSYLIASASVGKKIFRSRRGEVNLFVSDIFNQNVGFSRDWNAMYTQNTTNSVIGRYFGVKFVYNIRKFGKNGSQDPSRYEENGPRREGPVMIRERGGGGEGGGRMMMGPPPGGGGGGFGPR